MTAGKGKFGPLVGAIDEGTSSARFMIFKAQSFEVVCHHQEEVPQIYPQEGWVEQDPEKILTVVLNCIEGALRKLEELGGRKEDICAIGITNQRESSIVWDKNTGKPLHNAIIWLDMRTSTTVDQLLDNVPNHSRNKNYLKPLCGLPLSPYFSALKLRWLKDNIPDIKEAMEEGTCLFGTVDSWLIWNLTGGPNGGVHVTDVTNASRTMLLNIETLQWDVHLLKFFALPRHILPQVKSSAEVYGYMEVTSLKGVPICSCIGDQQAALVGQKCFTAGCAKATFGTGCFLLYNAGSVPVSSSHGLLSTVAYQFGKDANPVYALEGSVAIAGAAIGWLKNNMSLIDSSGEAEEIAKTVENCGDVYFVPAFSGLYAPYWNQEARGILCGLTEEVQKGHIVRAALEAVCFQVRDILEAMHSDCGVPLAKLKVDGGMTANRLLLQLQADLIGLSVIKPAMVETTALGAAIAAYYAISNFNLESLIGSEMDLVYEPQITEDERDMRYTKWKMAVERSLGWDTSTSDHRNLLSP